MPRLGAAGREALTQSASLARHPNATPATVGVIISDTFGRPWREGVVNVAIGVAGLRPFLDYRGCRDPYGREYQTPQRVDPGYLWGNRRTY